MQKSPAVCWCDAPAEYVNPATDATAETPVCGEHVADGYSPLSKSTSAPRKSPAPITAADLADIAYHGRTRDLPADWHISDVPGLDWLVTRDHGALVVGVGYVSAAQALDVARRTLAEDVA